MDKSWRCCVFSVLLVTVLAACSVAEILSKSVCVGDSIQLFQNITLPSFNIKVFLSKHGRGRKVSIAIWVKNASGTFPTILPNYKSKVLLENGTITLRNIQSTDEAIYSIEYDTAGRSATNEARIRALAPPAKSCKPKLRQEDDFLIALLDNPNYCGKPAVSVHWMEYPGISNNSKSVLKLKPGKDACTYYACIEGEALMCTRKSTEREYCEYITARSTREDNTPIPSSDSQPTTTTILVIVVLAILVIVIVNVLPMILWKCFGTESKCTGRVCSEARRRGHEPAQDETFPGQLNGNAETTHSENQESTEMEDGNAETTPLKNHESIEMEVKINNTKP